MKNAYTDQRTTPFNASTAWPDGRGILHVIAINGIGGAEKLLVDLLPATQEKGMPCSCLIFHQPAFVREAKSIGDALLEKGIPVIYQSYGSLLQKANRQTILSVVSQQKPLLIHAHLKHAELWLAMLKWMGKIRIPVVTTLHGYRDQYHNAFGLQWHTSAKKSFYYWLTRFTAANADRCISISNGITTFFIQSGLVKKEKIRTIYHGTNTGSLVLREPQPPRADFVLMGRLVRFKGHRYALEAIVHLKEKYPQAQLHIYGRGPEEENLRNMAVGLNIGENVFFHGFVQNLPEKLSSHSIALMPSIGEPFGLVFFDAFKAGLPVVAFDLPAGNEIIEHGHNGLLAKPLDTTSLAGQMELLLKSEILYQQIRQNALETLKMRFTITKMADRYIAYYCEIAGVPQKTPQ